MLQDRLLHYTLPEDSTGCWLWAGKTNSDGYGLLPENGAYKMAHRVAWELENGDIPEGVCVLHRCDTPPCVRVAHLFLGTKADNAHDRDCKGRNGQALKTHCPSGHEYDNDNTHTYPTPSGGVNRRCRACDRRRKQVAV